MKMRDMTIEEFCKEFGACPEYRQWALGTGCRMMSEVWRRRDLHPDWRLWILTRPGVADDRDLRLFAVRCARNIWHLITDDRSRNAVRVAEWYAWGEATGQELDAASSAARDAARDRQTLRMLRMWPQPFEKVEEGEGA